MIRLFYDRRCPFCLRVLNYLENEDIPFEHMVTPLGQASANRDELIRLGGSPRVPFLDDPEAGKRMYESVDIVAYLRERHAP